MGREWELPMGGVTDEKVLAFGGVEVQLPITFTISIIVHKP